MATISMSADKVIEAANNVISDIINERKFRDERLIADVMAVKRFSFKRMSFYYMDREQAIKYINDNSSFCTNRGFSMYAYGTLYDAKRLLKLAQHGDPVTLNQEDISVLF